MTKTICRISRYHLFTIDVVAKTRYYLYKHAIKINDKMYYKFCYHNKTKIYDVLSMTQHAIYKIKKCVLFTTKLSNENISYLICKCLINLFNRHGTQMSKQV